MSSSQLESYISLRNDVMIFKYFTGATRVLYYYDCLLTLPDEIKYAWKGRKTWIFWVFILNRYTPILYQTWLFSVGFLPQFTDRTYEYIPLRPSRILTWDRCDKKAFIQSLFFYWVTLLAQVTLTARIYALTLGKKRVTAFFSVITLVQFIMGVYVVTDSAIAPAVGVPPIPLLAYRMCFNARSPNVGMAHIVLSLFFDAMAFSVVVFVNFGTGLSLAAGEWLPGGRPSILRTILEDATVYFLVIFSSHLLALVVMLVARPSLKILSGPGNLVLTPLMISRLMLSLKKASKVGESGWTLSRTYPRTITQIAFRGLPAGPEDTYDDSELSDGRVRRGSSEGTA